MFNSMKEIATALMEVALNSGYEYDMLCECVEDLVYDGESYNKAFHEVESIANEHDF